MPAACARRPHRCPVPGFGNRGVVDLGAGVGMSNNTDYNVSSPPAILRDLVVTGSAIGDNFSSYTGSGVVRAWDARTGQERWHWNPVENLADGTRIGAANAWAVISADSARDLVFVPTSARVPISSAGGGRATIAGETRWWRCGDRPASWSGDSRPCTTICSTTTTPRSRCS